jgi:hypothetical protein
MVKLFKFDSGPSNSLGLSQSSNSREKMTGVPQAPVVPPCDVDKMEGVEGLEHMENTGQGVSRQTSSHEEDTESQSEQLSRDVGITVRTPPSSRSNGRSMDVRQPDGTVREPQIRPDKKLNLSRPINRRAYRATKVGKLNLPACEPCQRGRGPWTEFVSNVGDARGSCTNCQYNSHGATCNLRRAATI